MFSSLSVSRKSAQFLVGRRQQLFRGLRFAPLHRIKQSRYVAHVMEIIEGMGRGKGPTGEVKIKTKIEIASEREVASERAHDRWLALGHDLGLGLARV
jgi:hypothetical protein